MMMRTTAGSNTALSGNISFLCDIPSFSSDFDSPCTDQKFAMVKFAKSLGMEDDVDFYETDFECDWPGITCNGNGAIIKIKLGKF